MEIKYQGLLCVVGEDDTTNARKTMRECNGQKMKYMDYQLGKILRTRTMHDVLENEHTKRFQVPRS